jgi:hypothetical protein
MRASSLPALSQCPSFESGSTEWTESGTDRHTALADHFTGGNDTMLNLLDDDEQDGIRWAADYIRLKANLAEHPITWEKENSCTAILDDFTEIPGTPDAICGIDIFDLKWRYRDYTAQMALYAAARLQELPGIDKVRVHLLFAAFKRAEILEFDRESALGIVEKIVAKVRENPAPQPCDYCGWCAKRVCCPALNERAQTVAAGREDWTLEQYHASAITSPTEMAKALRLAAQIEKWAKAVKHFAKEMVLKQGVTIPGYELTSKAGKASCADVIGAFNASGLQASEFLQACELRLNTSKKNPAKKGIIDLYYTINKGISKAAAKRELKRLLDPYMRTPTLSYSLKAINSTEDDEETED